MAVLESVEKGGRYETDQIINVSGKHLSNGLRVDFVWGHFWSLIFFISLYSIFQKFTPQFWKK